jgi:hypothetical protein
VRISPEGARKFASLYIFLMYYAGQERKMLPRDMSLDDFKEASLEMKVACRNAIYEPRPLISRFLDANRYLLTEEAQATLASWARGYVKGSFYVLRHLKQYSIFLVADGKVRAYGVLGLNDELDKIIPKETLPAYVEAVLLPFEGVIVCDGLVSPVDVPIEPSMRQEMAQEYKALKQTGELITTLG